jgi:flagellar hook protein FlgE
MSLYGALFSGVAGLNSQSTKLSILSDNIANVNTVGYKGGNALFQSLVTGISSNTTYSPGGVLGGAHQSVDQQGLLQSTQSPTDIAIQGSGLFVVNATADGNGQVLYTRAGSFTQDSLGNFKNSSGFFLQAWPLDRSGDLPGAPGNTDTNSSANLSSLKTVNVQNLTGAASATNTIALSANLNASSPSYHGASVTASMDLQNAINLGISGKDIITPGGVDNLSIGDKFNLSNAGVNYTYTYGGFTTSRSVSNTSVLGDSGVPLATAQTTLGTGTSTLDASTTLAAPTTLSSTAFATDGNNDGDVIVYAPGHNLKTGDWITIAGVTGAGVGGITAAQLNGNFKITVVDGDHYKITTLGSSTSATNGGNANVTSTIIPFQTVNGDKNIYVTAPTHGLNTGDYVTVSETTAIGGITGPEMSGSFPITVIDANHYSYLSTSASGATSNNEGGDPTATAKIVPFKTLTVGQGDVQITAPSTKLAVGDYVTISGVSGASFGGITAANLTGTFRVKSVAADGNHYTIATSGTATTANVAGGPTTTSITADIEPFSASANSKTVMVYQPAHGLKTGDVVSLSGNTGVVGDIPADNLNGSFVVTVIDANHYTITSPVASTIAGGGGAGTISATTRPFAGDILDAQTASQPFLGITGTAGFTAAALTFSITTPSVGTTTFTYNPASPNAQLGQFSNLNNLATAINNVNGLSARVVNNQLYVGATDAGDSVTFANGSTKGVSGPPVQAGIDWVQELGVSNIPSSINKFSTLQGLADLVNASTGFTATVNNPLGDASLSITSDDPLGTMTLSDKPNVSALAPSTNMTPFSTTAGSNVVTVTSPVATNFVTGDIVHLDSNTLTGTPFNGIPVADLTGDFTITVINNTTFTINVAHKATFSGATGDKGLVITPPNNKGSILAALGLKPSLVGGFTPQTTGPLGPSYDPTDSTKNMASGAVTPQFSRPITVYDSLGTAHSLNVGFIKTGSNVWAVEVYSQPASDVNSTLPNGQLAAGSVIFNGDGSLRNVSSGLTSGINGDGISINWTNGSVPSKVTFNLGTAGQPFGTLNAASIGKTDGLSQFDSANVVHFVNQNGAPVGSLTGVAIDQNGYIIANYSNGETQKLYKIPLATFASPDELSAVSGNVFEQSGTSGQVALVQAGVNGTGTISSASLEASNVELANQLTDMIVAQRAYQANTKVISTADSLLNALDQILQ